MRLGISTSLNGLSPKQWADRLTELGCRSVVFPVDCNADSALISAYAEEAASHDLMIAEVGIWRNAISPNHEEAAGNLDYSIRQLALAESLGARCCVNVAGSTGPRWDGGYRDNFSEETFEKTVTMIQTVIDAVKPVKTTFSIESMPWMIPTGPEEYLKLIKAVDRSAFSAHLDIINMVNTPERYFFSTEFLEKCFRLLGPHIRSCHLKDIRLLPDYTFCLKECACGEGTFNLRRYLELADATDPDMPMIIEHLTSDEAYAESVRYVKDLF